MDVWIEFYNKHVSTVLERQSRYKTPRNKNEIHKNNGNSIKRFVDREDLLHNCTIP